MRGYLVYILLEYLEILINRYNRQIAMLLKRSRFISSRARTSNLYFTRMKNFNRTSKAGAFFIQFSSLNYPEQQSKATLRSMQCKRSEFPGVRRVSKKEIYEFKKLAVGNVCDRNNSARKLPLIYEIWRKALALYESRRYRDARGIFAGAMGICDFTFIYTDNTVLDKLQKDSGLRFCN